MFPFAHPSRTLTKICGLTNLPEALHCAEVGADAIGINFFSKSKRYHPMNEAERWLDRLPRHLARVAVLVNPAPDVLQSIAASGLIDVLQFHGDETPEDLTAARRFGLPIIKALPLLPETSAESLRLWPADAVLLDAYAPGAYGGTGHTIDWSRAAAIIGELAPFPVILSGGLTADNIRSAVATTRPAGVDTASGVETSPGRKDPGKVQAFVQNTAG